MTNDETTARFFVIDSFGIRHSFVIGYFVIRHSSEAPESFVIQAKRLRSLLRPLQL